MSLTGSSPERAPALAADLEPGADIRRLDVLAAGIAHAPPLLEAGLTAYRQRVRRWF